jgi:hypothetical protein
MDMPRLVAGGIHPLPHAGLVHPPTILYHHRRLDQPLSRMESRKLFRSHVISPPSSADGVISSYLHYKYAAPGPHELRLLWFFSRNYS